MEQQTQNNMCFTPSYDVNVENVSDIFLASVFADSGSPCFTPCPGDSSSSFTAVVEPSAAYDGSVSRLVPVNDAGFPADEAAHGCTLVNANENEQYGFVSSSEFNSNATAVTDNTNCKKSKKCSSFSRRHSETADKQSDEYRLKRERNNKFVRLCREKARERHKEIEQRVARLQSENKQLSQKVDALTSELAIYKNLFTSVGASVPPEVDVALAKSVSQDKQ